jgi:hypothetical protein
MNVALEQGMSAGSTTRISTDLEQLWRNQFFVQQERTAESFASTNAIEPQRQLRQMTDNVRFAGGAYDPTIIHFYEDIIVELQREVERYKSLWASSLRAAQTETPETYFARQTAPLSPAMARKLRSRTRPGLRVSTE